MSSVINGAHFVLYSSDPEADRAFLRDVLELRSVDAGHGWLIFALPPAEVALHPMGEGSRRDPGGSGFLGADLYLLCDDLAATLSSLAGKGVVCGEVGRERWGSRTTIPLPSGGRIGLYQPAHETALGLTGS